MADKVRKRNRVYVVGGDRDVDFMFTENGWEVVSSMRHADLIQFTGGSDISPLIYKRRKHARTSPCDPWRDKIECGVFNLGLQHGMKMAGICRGLQLMNCLLGGELWQDVDGHSGSHPVNCDFFNFKYTANSIHHQQIIPPTTCYVMAMAHKSKKKEKVDESGHLDIFRPAASLDPEVAYYESNRCFGVQWHPEYPCKEEPDLDEIYISYVNDVLMSD